MQHWRGLGMESEKWTTKKLGEVVNLKRGYDLPVSKRESGAVPILSSSGISDFHNEYKVKGPGVTTGRSGLLGKVYYVEDDFWPLNTSLYVEDFKGNDPKFVYYLLQTMKLENYNAGSSVPTLNRNHVHLIDVNIPAKSIQVKMGDILYNFERKIENNNRIIYNLEQLAQTIFKHWFVDFEFPNENSEPYKSSAGEMVESSLGLIPEKWEIKEIGDVLELSYGKALKKENRISGKYPVYGSNGIVDYHNKALVEGPGIIVGRKGTVGTVNLEHENFFPIDTAFYVTRKNKNLNWSYLYLVLSSQNLADLSGDSAVPGLNRNHAHKNLFLMPTISVIYEFNKIIDSFFIEIYNLKKEIDKLSSIRNILLSKLLSGEIELPSETEVTDHVPIP